MKYNENYLKESKKYFRVKDEKGNTYYSEEYGVHSECSESIHVEFNQNSEILYGKIKYFVEVPLSNDHKYNFACIECFYWDRSSNLHLLDDLNRYITDGTNKNEQILVKLEDLRRIVGLFPLKKKINNKNVNVIIPF